jgi:hypothetical protein
LPSTQPGDKLEKFCSGTVFGILVIAKALKVLLVMAVSETYTAAVFDLVKEFTIWVNILEIFGKEATA